MTTEMRKAKITDKTEITSMGTSITPGFRRRENTSIGRKEQSQSHGG